jgi:hypothetical protein
MARMFMAIAFCIFLANAAFAETSTPRWEIHDVCSGPKPEACLKVENTERLTTLARWPNVPSADREICMREIDRDNVRSYQRLNNCFDDQALKALDGK